VALPQTRTGSGFDSIDQQTADGRLTRQEGQFAGELFTALLPDLQRMIDKSTVEDDTVNLLMLEMPGRRISTGLIDRAPPGSDWSAVDAVLKDALRAEYRFRTSNLATEKSLSSFGQLDAASTPNFFALMLDFVGKNIGLALVQFNPGVWPFAATIPVLTDKLVKITMSQNITSPSDAVRFIRTYWQNFKEILPSGQIGEASSDNMRPIKNVVRTASEHNYSFSAVLNREGKIFFALDMKPEQIAAEKSVSKEETTAALTFSPGSRIWQMRGTEDGLVYLVRLLRENGAKDNDNVFFAIGETSQWTSSGLKDAEAKILNYENLWLLSPRPRAGSSGLIAGGGGGGASVLDQLMRFVLSNSDGRIQSTVRLYDRYERNIADLEESLAAIQNARRAGEAGLAQLEAIGNQIEKEELVRRFNQLLQGQVDLTKKLADIDTLKDWHYDADNWHQFFLRSDEQISDKYIETVKDEIYGSVIERRLRHIPLDPSDLRLFHPASVPFEEYKKDNEVNWRELPKDLLEFYLSRYHSIWKKVSLPLWLMYAAARHMVLATPLGRPAYDFQQRVVTSVTDRTRPAEISMQQALYDRLLAADSRIRSAREEEKTLSVALGTQKFLFSAARDVVAPPESQRYGEEYDSFFDHFVWGSEITPVLRAVWPMAIDKPAVKRAVKNLFSLKIFEGLHRDYRELSPYGIYRELLSLDPGDAAKTLDIRFEVIGNDNKFAAFHTSTWDQLRDVENQIRPIEIAKAKDYDRARRLPPSDAEQSLLDRRKALIESYLRVIAMLQTVKESEYSGLGLGRLLERYKIGEMVSVAEVKAVGTSLTSRTYYQLYEDAIAAGVKLSTVALLSERIKNTEYRLKTSYTGQNFSELFFETLSGGTADNRIEMLDYYQRSSEKWPISDIRRIVEDSGLANLVHDPAEKEYYNRLAGETDDERALFLVSAKDLVLAQIRNELFNNAGFGGFVLADWAETIKQDFFSHGAGFLYHTMRDWHAFKGNFKAYFDQYASTWSVTDQALYRILLAHPQQIWPYLMYFHNRLGDISGTNEIPDSFFQSLSDYELTQIESFHYLPTSKDPSALPLIKRLLDNPQSNPLLKLILLTSLETDEHFSLPPEWYQELYPTVVRILLDPKEETELRQHAVSFLFDGDPTDTNGFIKTLSQALNDTEMGEKTFSALQYKMGKQYVPLLFQIVDLLKNGKLKSSGAFQLADMFGRNAGFMTPLEFARILRTMFIDPKFHSKLSSFAGHFNRSDFTLNDLNRMLALNTMTQALGLFDDPNFIAETMKLIGKLTDKNDSFSLGYVQRLFRVLSDSRTTTSKKIQLYTEIIDQYDPNKVFLDELLKQTLDSEIYTVIRNPKIPNKSRKEFIERTLSHPELRIPLVDIMNRYTSGKSIPAWVDPVNTVFLLQYFMEKPEDVARINQMEHIITNENLANVLNVKSDLQLNLFNLIHLLFDAKQKNNEKALRHLGLSVMSTEQREILLQLIQSNPELLIHARTSLYFEAIAITSELKQVTDKDRRHKKILEIVRSIDTQYRLFERKVFHGEPLADTDYAYYAHFLRSLDYDQGQSQKFDEAINSIANVYNIPTLGRSLTAVLRDIDTHIITTLIPKPGIRSFQILTESVKIVVPSEDQSRLKELINKVLGLQELINTSKLKEAISIINEKVDQQDAAFLEERSVPAKIRTDKPENIKKYLFSKLQLSEEEVMSIVHQVFSEIGLDDLVKYEKGELSDDQTSTFYIRLSQSNLILEHILSEQGLSDLDVVIKRSASWKTLTKLKESIAYVADKTNKKTKKIDLVFQPKNLLDLFQGKCSGGTCFGWRPYINARSSTAVVRILVDGELMGNILFIIQNNRMIMSGFDYSEAWAKQLSNEKMKEFVNLAMEQVYGFARENGFTLMITMEAGGLSNRDNQAHPLEQYLVETYQSDQKVSVGEEVFNPTSSITYTVSSASPLKPAVADKFEKNYIESAKTESQVQPGVQNVQAPKRTIDLIKTDEWELIRADILRIEEEAFKGNGYSEEQLQHDFTDPDNVVVIARDAVTGKVIGYSYAIPGENNQTMYISSSAILTEFQGKGLIGEIKKVQEAELLRRKVKYITADAAIDNGYADSMQRFYGDRVIETHDHDSPYGRQRFMRIRLIAKKNIVTQISGQAAQVMSEMSNCSVAYGWIERVYAEDGGQGSGGCGLLVRIIKRAPVQVLPKLLQFFATHNRFPNAVELQQLFPMLYQGHLDQPMTRIVPNFNAPSGITARPSVGMVAGGGIPLNSLEQAAQRIIKDGVETIEQAAERGENCGKIVGFRLAHPVYAGGPSAPRGCSLPDRAAASVVHSRWWKPTRQGLVAGGGMMPIRIIAFRAAPIGLLAFGIICYEAREPWHQKLCGKAAPTPPHLMFIAKTRKSSD
jgi:hypothetical protein